MEKKPKRFSRSKSKRAKIQTMARKRIHSDKVQNVAVHIGIVPFVIFPWENDRTNPEQI